VKLSRRTQVPLWKKIPHFEPGRVFVIDFRVLARPTKEGHKLILGLIDSYSHASKETLIEGSAITTVIKGHYLEDTSVLAGRTRVL
jgi:hypothetical protein